ncbi:MAG: hypothetical protein OJF49_000347 [Ktedonobacterales bacterium]|nr:MAG: hypothetical protein OJF49_000347 [Ktedonobacterales bacterium]
MKDTRYALGIDVGGTKIYAGVIALETGEVVGSARKRTHPERGADFFTKRLQEVAADALESVHLPSTAQVAAIGVGLAGQVDRERGLLRGAPNLARGVEDLPLRDLLEKAFDLPVILGNDAEVATYGEQHYGAGRECDDFICIYVGTGIGSAIVHKGVLRRGATGTAGEIGHTVVQYGGRMCGCGGRGHLEAYASRSAITKVLFAELARGRTSKLQDYLKPDETAIRSKTIARCEEEKDPLMLETLSEAADYLGAGLGSLASFLNPSRIIIGGGLIEGTTFLFERASLRAREVALPVPGRALEIVRTGLGDDGGIVGAAWMAVHMRPKKDS